MLMLEHFLACQTLHLQPPYPPPCKIPNQAVQVHVQTETSTFPADALFGAPFSSVERHKERLHALQ